MVTEVKTKTSDFFGAAIEMITPAKQRKLVLLTQLLQAQYQTDNVRIDVVAIDFVQQNRSAAKNNAQGEPRLRHYPGVIEFHG